MHSQQFVKGFVQAGNVTSLPWIEFAYVDVIWLLLYAQMHN
jgi:hypothetical protein